VKSTSGKMSRKENRLKYLAMEHGATVPRRAI
jgi:hypothetical protein